jgi:hypothetical protein
MHRGEVSNMTRTFSLASLALLGACASPSTTPVTATALCGQIASAVCAADQHCFPDTHPTGCVDTQSAACQATVRPLVDDARLSFDPIAAGRFVDTLHARASSCGASPVDYAAFTAMFAGTGAPGADCTPHDLSAASLRSSSLSCESGSACRLYLRADGSTQGVCERRSDSSCSHAFDCGADQFCDLPAHWQPGVWGSCRPLRSDGWACGGDLECASRHCDGACGALPPDLRPLVATYSTVVRGAQPIAYLRFGETGGARALDVIGGHDGTLVGTTMPNAHGAIAHDADGAIHLSGGGYVQLAALTALADTDELSLECWFSPTTTMDNHPILELSDGMHYGPHVWQFDSGDKIYTNLVDAMRGDHSIMSDAGAISASAWHHVVATYDGASGALYLDGHRVGTTGMSGPLLVDGSLYVGHRVAMGMSPAVSFDGSIDELAVYDHALSASTVARHHDTGTSGTASNAFPLFSWLR